jgi:LPS sulfotransferase NodH
MAHARNAKLMPSPGLIAIIGSPRSGTTAFGQALAQAVDAAYLGEIFHAVRGPQDDIDFERFLVVPWTNFFSFKEEVIKEFPAFIYPSRKNQDALWALFLERMRERAGKATLVIDIKYNSLDHMNHIWQEPSNPPHMLRILSAAKVPLFHIVRNDLFAQAVSIQRAQVTGLWHLSASKAPREAGAIKIDPRLAARFMQTTSANRRLVTNFLRPHKPVLELAYEDIFTDDGDLTSETRERIGSFLDLDMSFSPELKLQKIVTQPLGMLVANQDEVSAFFRGHRFEKEVRKWIGSRSEGG